MEIFGGFAILYLAYLGMKKAAVKVFGGSPARLREHEEKIQKQKKIINSTREAIKKIDSKMEKNWRYYWVGAYVYGLMVLCVLVILLICAGGAFLLYWLFSLWLL